MAGINTIVNAIQTVLLTVPNMGTVYTYTPIEPIDPSQYPYAIITDIRQKEERHGMPYRTGIKWIYHTIQMEVHTETPSPDVDQVPWHDFLDSIRTKLRYDPALGGVTLRFAEDIEIEWTIQASGTMVQYDAFITSEALEEIIG
jgi:hypothetical protein